ncbi:MAG: hypothetical protein ABR962_00935 [Candidatus Bathyarchaeia archaeon]|jgi:uncharacterized coiled-coil DUF342 family protein
MGKAKKKGRKKARRNFSDHARQPIDVENIRKKICERTNQNVKTDAERSDVTLKLRRLSFELKSHIEEVSELKRMFEELANPRKKMKNMCLEDSRTATNQEPVVRDSYSYLRWLIKKSNSLQSEPSTMKQANTQ